MISNTRGLYFNDNMTSITLTDPQSAYTEVLYLILNIYLISFDLIIFIPTYREKISGKNILSGKILSDNVYLSHLCWLNFTSIVHF